MTTLPTAEQVCELPDDIRVPLHSLSADIRYLFGRVAADGTLASMMADSAASRLSQIEEASYRLNALIAAQAAEIERLTKERDVAVGERIARSKLMQRLRDTLVDILEGIEDEGDRTYFGSSNDADELRDGFRTLEDWNWHDILRDEKLVDPFEMSRNAIARAEAAEASLAAVTAERDVMREAGKTAIFHIEHMARWIGDLKSGYSFESLGEDMPGIRAALSLDTPEVKP